MRTAILGACAVAVLSSLAPAAQAPVPGAPVLYDNVRLIPGDGNAAIERAAMLVENGTIARVAPAGAITVPPSVRRVDLAGRTIIPALIGTHGHPGFQQGLSYSAANYTRETVISDLPRALYFGVSVVRADFLVLDANPLDDITNTRRISRIVIGNVEVDRQALVALMR